MKELSQLEIEEGGVVTMARVKWPLAAAVIFVAATISAPAVATGFFESGNSLYDTCKNGKRWRDNNYTGVKDGAQDSASCSGFIEGAIDQLTNLGDEVAVCLSNQMSVGQAVDVVLKYLADHPEKRLHNGAGLVKAALDDGFCKQ